MQEAFKWSLSPICWPPLSHSSCEASKIAVFEPNYPLCIAGTIAQNTYISEPSHLKGEGVGT